MGHGQQDLHFDTMAKKHQMNPTVYQNYPSGVSMAQPVTSAPLPYEGPAFHMPFLPYPFPSEVPSLYKRLDFTPMNVTNGIQLLLF